MKKSVISQEDSSKYSNLYIVINSSIVDQTSARLIRHHKHIWLYSIDKQYNMWTNSVLR